MGSADRIADQYPLVATYIANERLCCPWLRFTLEVTGPGQGPFWLRITGGPAVKAALQAALIAEAPVPSTVGG